MVEIGLVGPPSAGKSTFFKAATMKDVKIADYPFTTIEPNEGTAFVRAKCPEEEIGTKCTPGNAPCLKGWRFVPFKLWDVAGLVEGAYQGRGRGNEFLNDIAKVDGIIVVVDVSGKTNEEGLSGKGDPLKAVRMIESELDHWIASLLLREERKLKSGELSEGIARRLSGLKITKSNVERALEREQLPSPGYWKEEDILGFASELRKVSKPMLVVGNKIDLGGEENLERLEEYGYNVVPASAYYELALREAARKGIISYVPGDRDFEVLVSGYDEAVEKLREFLSKRPTGVQQAMNKMVFDILQCKHVFPVMDESTWKDSRGRVLPDVFLVGKDSTPRDVAFMLHEDIGKGFISAVDGRTKRRIPSDEPIEDGQIISIKSK